MQRWGPSPMWQDEDAYVVGGGPSLASFDWGLLRGKNTIGCNSAFILGADIIKICLFADLNWWEQIGVHKLPSFGGIVVACCPSLEDVSRALPDWLLSMPREDNRNGLSLDKLGFNGNTGSLAINLALRLGARRVFLLGFDMKMEGQKMNWHTERYEAPKPEILPMFMQRLAHVARDVPVMFPGREVINVSDVSELKVFPVVSLAEHFGLKGEGS